MSVKMYKEQNSKRVRGINVKAHLDTGWTFEPVTKAKLRPRKKILPKMKLEVGEVEVITNIDLSGPEDLNNKE